MQSCGWPSKTRLSPCLLPCRIFGRSTSKCVGINIRKLQNGEPWNSALSGWKAWLTPRYTPLPTCYHVKSGSSATKGLRTNRREPPNLGSAMPPPPWGWCVADHLKTTPFPYAEYVSRAWGADLPFSAPLTYCAHMCYYVKFGSSSINGVHINRKEPYIPWILFVVLT